MSLPPFQAVLDQHRADVYRFLVATVGGADADDCFQETWLAALRAYPRLRNADNLRGWLLRIAQRKTLDMRRAQRRRPIPSAALPEQPSAGVDDGEPELWERVRRLPHRQRTAVFLRSVLGLPYPDVARALDCSEPAARRSVHEGLSKLREEAERWTS